MKKIILFFFLITFTLSSQAQWINSLTVLPANPTTNDTITILADCMFPNGTCDSHTQSVAVNGNTINAYALHCMGVLTIICNHTDTFIIPPLPTGSYTFNFQLDAGQFPSPCTPGIIAGPNDSIIFTVSLPTSIGEYISHDGVTAMPNPTNGHLKFNGLSPEDYPVRVDIYSINGKQLMQQWVRQPQQSIDITHLAKGMLQLQLFTKSEKHILVNVLKE